MTTFISAKNLSMQNTDFCLFEDLSFTISKGERIGLVGRNGVGKSTLLKILNGELLPTGGNVIKSGGCIIGMVEQHLPENIKNKILIDAILDCFPGNNKGDSYWRAEALLINMGFSSDEKDTKCMSLSGGQQSRALLARAIANSPDFIIMDEPSNHLDISSIIWLESFLQNWNGGYIISSHDSKLLDTVTNKTWFLRDKKISSFSMSYSKAKLELLKGDESDRLRRQAEEKEIDRVSSSAQRLAFWGKNYDSKSLSRKAKSMEKHLEVLVEKKIELTEGDHWKLNLNGDSLVADKTIDFVNFSINPSGKKVILNVTDLHVKPNQHIGIIGRNGAGKSSLLTSIWNEINSIKGNQDGIKFNPRVRAGYYDQNLQQLSDNDTIFEALERFQTNPLIRKQSLIKAGYKWERHNQIVNSLSGGERSRLLFLGLSLAKHNLLMLDEPTNHLDINGKDELAQNLSAFPGSFLLVSHDRDFINSCCNHIWFINNGVIYTYDSLEYVEHILEDENGCCVKKNVDSLHQNIINEIPADDIIDRIIALQNKIDEDKSRKKKHQKLKLQETWQIELNALYLQLNEL